MTIVERPEETGESDGLGDKRGEAGENCRKSGGLDDNCGEAGGNCRDRNELDDDRGEAVKLTLFLSFGDQCNVPEVSTKKFC